MKENIANKVKEFLTPVIENLGYDVVDVEFVKKNDGNNLTVFIDKKGGVSLDDCVLVHQTIDTPLDDLDPTQGEHYILNVSSPGLDRPIKTDEDLKRNLGEHLEASTYAKIGTRKHFDGILSDFNETEITLVVDNKPLTIARDNISKLNKYIDF